MEDFTWSKINLHFPECRTDPTGIEESFWKEFLQKPEFRKDYIRVLFGDYGLSIHLNQKIPNWVGEKEKRGVEKIYANLSKEIYREVADELTKSYEIFESWREFVQKWDAKNGWVGNLQNNIKFTNFGTGVSHGDYYTNYPNSSIKLNSPTSVLNRIGNLPKDSLNETWKKYQNLSKNVFYGGENRCNSITGKTLTDCIQNADEIYKIAPELKKLF